jgi:hypothetical protein
MEKYNLYIFGLVGIMLILSFLLYFNYIYVNMLILYMFQITSYLSVKYTSDVEEYIRYYMRRGKFNVMIDNLYHSFMLFISSLCLVLFLLNQFPNQDSMDINEKIKNNWFFLIPFIFIIILQYMINFIFLYITYNIDANLNGEEVQLIYNIDINDINDNYSTIDI